MDEWVECHCGMRFVGVDEMESHALLRAHIEEQVALDEPGHLFKRSWVVEERWNPSKLQGFVRDDM